MSGFICYGTNATYPTFPNPKMLRGKIWSSTRQRLGVSGWLYSNVYDSSHRARVDMFPVSQVTERRQSLVGGGGRKLLLVSSCSKVLDTLNLESLHQYKINSRSQKCGKSSPAQSLLALKSLHQGRSCHKGKIHRRWVRDFGTNTLCSV